MGDDRYFQSASIAEVSSADLRAYIREAGAIDRAVYASVAKTPTPRLDVFMRSLSRAANHSRLSLACAGVFAAVGGPTGRRAAASGLASVAATSAFVNLGLKQVGRRQRPDRGRGLVPTARRVAMPKSPSFPSGHAASAFAFASGAARVSSAASLPLHALAALVAYSRVHTGVHYPSDVLAGALAGTAIADLTAGALEQMTNMPRSDGSTSSAPESTVSPQL